MNTRGVSEVEEDIINNIAVDGGWYSDNIETVYNPVFLLLLLLSL